MNGKKTEVITKSIEVYGITLEYNMYVYANFVECRDIMIFDNDRPEDCLLINKVSKIKHLKKVLDEFLLKEVSE